MDQELLIELTADIVSAHVSNNSVAVGDLPRLVGEVHQALAGLDASEAVEEAKEPVVSIRASKKPDHLICLECGKKQKTLKRHLNSAHGLTPDQYRTDYNLPADYPMVAPDYSKKRSEMAKDIGLGRKAGTGSAGRKSASKPKAK